MESDPEPPAHAVPSSPAGLSSPSTDLNPSSVTSDPLEEIRSEVDRIIEDEALDKVTALRVAQLFHRMETLLRYECNKRDRHILETRNDLEMSRMQGELDRMVRRQTTMETPPDLSRGRSVRR